MANTVQDRDLHYSIHVYPLRCKTIKEVLRVINTKVHSTCKNSSKQGYDANRHQFQLTRVSDHYRLKQGLLLVCTVGENLAYFLSLSYETLRNKDILVTLEVNALSNHSRQLRLISNVIQPMAYCKHERQILCDFLHMQTQILLWKNDLISLAFILMTATALI